MVEHRQNPENGESNGRSRNRFIAQALLSLSGRLPFAIDTVIDILNECNVPYILKGHPDAIGLARTLGFVRCSTTTTNASSIVILHLVENVQNLRMGEWILYPLRAFRCGSVRTRRPSRRINTFFRNVDVDGDDVDEKKRAIIYAAVVEAGASRSLGERTIVVFSSKCLRIAIKYALIASGFDNVAIVGSTALPGLLACPKRGYPDISIICDSRTLSDVTYFGQCGLHNTNIRITVVH
jgi:hypothetical protein